MLLTAETAVLVYYFFFLNLSIFTGVSVASVKKISIFFIPNGTFPTVLWLMKCSCAAVLKHCAVTVC